MAILENNKRMQSLLLAACLGLSLVLMLVHSAQAASQEKALQALRVVVQAIDKNARVREDMLVTFSDGREYVVVTPGEPKQTDNLWVVGQLPKDSNTPDLIELSDGRFLLRIVTLPNGRKSFPILNEVPLPLRTALLPQSFTFPEGFLIPTIWKSLTGNLLITPASETGEGDSYPLVLVDADNKALILWNTARAEITRKFHLPCQAGNLIATRDARQLIAACADQPALYVFPVEGEESFKVSLLAPAGELLQDDSQSLMYISHPLQPVLSVYDIETRSITRAIALKHPANQLAMSPFRKQLFAASVIRPRAHRNETTDAAKQAGFKNFFFRERVVLTSEDRDPWYRVPNVQLINLRTMTMEKRLPAVADLSMMLVQDEKILWMASREEKLMKAFDLRWQEFTSEVTLPEEPVDLAADERWLYLLSRESGRLLRLNLQSLAWGSPIALEPDTRPGSFILDPVDALAYVVSLNKPGVQVVNLNRGEWVGTQITGFTGSNRMAWMIPVMALPDQQVRIKFQDGRLLYPGGQKLQPEKLLSGPRAPRKSHSPQEPEETPLAP